MISLHRLEFDQAEILAVLNSLDDAGLDALDFGVIAFDGDLMVRRYNLHESQATGLVRQRVLDHQLFTDVAQCMNNYLVAQKFLDAAREGHRLDETMDFVLTWRMRPTPVKLRLLASPELRFQYLLLQRVA